MTEGKEETNEEREEGTGKIEKDKIKNWERKNLKKERRE